MHELSIFFHVWGGLDKSLSVQAKGMEVFVYGNEEKYRQVVGVLLARLRLGRDDEDVHCREETVRSGIAASISCVEEGEETRRWGPLAQRGGSQLPQHQEKRAGEASEGETLSSAHERTSCRYDVTSR